MSPTSSRRAAALVAALLVCRGAVAATPDRLLPVDEAAKQPAFFSARAALQAAVARHDVAAVTAALDPAIRTSFGGGGGRKDFLRQWKPDDPASRLWSELGALLALGGSFPDESTFVAPYVYGRWPERFDAFEHVAIVGDGVRVRAAAASSARVIARLDFAIVRLAPRGGGRASSGWTAILVPGGGRGFVASSLVRSPVGYRAIFRRGPAGWRMSALVSGD